MERIEKKDGIEFTYDETDAHLVRQAELDFMDNIFSQRRIDSFSEEDDSRLSLNDVPKGYKSPLGKYLDFLESAQYLNPDAIWENTSAKRDLLSKFGIERLNGGNTVHTASPTQIGRVVQNHYSTAERVMLEYGMYLME